MTRGSEVYAVLIAAIGLAAVSLGAAFMYEHLPLLVVGGTLLLWVASKLVQVFLVRARWKALADAFDAEDSIRARKVLDKLSAMRLVPQARSALILVRGSILSFEEHYAETRAVIETVDPRGLALPLRITRDNDLAWAMAHDGAAVEAIPLAERAIAALTPEVPAVLASCCVGTLGVSQLKAGRLAEARETLERALALGGSPRLIATRAFYLGETLALLGHADEAAEAYEKAVRAMPEGRYGKKAKAALAAIASTRPYRG